MPLNLKLLGEDSATAVELANKECAVSFSAGIVPLDLLEALIVLDQYQLLAFNQISKLGLVEIDIFVDKLRDKATLDTNLVFGGPVVVAAELVCFPHL
jgi:hypothetical protein